MPVRESLLIESRPSFWFTRRAAWRDGSTSPLSTSASSLSLTTLASQSTPAGSWRKTSRSLLRNPNRWGANFDRGGRKLSSVLGGQLGKKSLLRKRHSLLVLQLTPFFFASENWSKNWRFGLAHFLCVYPALIWLLLSEGRSKNHWNHTFLPKD